MILAHYLDFFFALGIEAEILFVPQGKKIAAESPTHRGTPI
jgi:hypothetical protein